MNSMHGGVYWSGIAQLFDISYGAGNWKTVCGNYSTRPHEYRTGVIGSSSGLYFKLNQERPLTQEEKLARGN